MVLVSDLSGGGKKVMLLRRGFHGLKRDIPSRRNSFRRQGHIVDSQRTQFVLPVQPGSDLLKQGHIYGQRACMLFSDNKEHSYVRRVDNK